MRRVSPLSLLGGLLLSLILVPAVLATPLAWFSVGGQDFVIGQEYWSEIDGYNFLNYSHSASNFSVTTTAVGKPDPYLSYGLTVINSSSAPLTFTFGYLTPIVPITMPNIVYGSFSGSVTDPTGNGLTITPTGARMQSNFVNGTTNMGVDVGFGKIQPPGWPPGQSSIIPMDQSGPQPGPLGSWTTLSSVVSFTLTGNNDIATLNGFASINPVPEPATLLLLGLGLVGASVAHARRRRR